MVRLQVSTTGILVAVIAVLLIGAALKKTTTDYKNKVEQSQSSKISSNQQMKKEVAACTTTGTDYVLITDRSGSMKDNNKGVLAQQAAKNFIDQIAGQPGARVGLVSFEDVGDETTDLNLTTNFSQAKSVIDTYVFTGMTCTRCGINLARTQYNNNGRAGAKKVVILLTDGMPWHTDDWYDTQEDEKEIQNILNVAQTHWSQAQMQIHAIGLGTAKFENFLPDLVAISGGQSYITTDGSQLNTFYNQILASVTPRGVVSGSVYNDTNTNGAANTGEGKLAGWNVTMNGQTVTTDSNGNYTFNNVCDGTHALTITLKPSWFATGPTSVNVTVTNGNTQSGRLFFVAQGYSVTGNLYIDANRNGVKDAGESNYTGATITRSGPSSGSTTTDGSGNYSFGSVIPGAYQVSVSVPAGYQATTANPVSVNINGNSSVNFGIAPLFAISGNVFLDANRNGIKDTGETNFQSVSINRTGVSSGSTATDASGNYSFTNLTPGNYSISATAPAGYMLTTTSPVARTIGPSTAVNFGVALLFTYTGNVFIDTNRDGVKQVGETNFTGVTVTRTGVTSGSTTTDASGNYSFSGLAPGNYSVGINVPAGYQMSTASPVSRTLGPNAVVNFGLSLLYSIQGNVFVDGNKNGIKDAGESNYTGIPSVGASRGTVTNNNGGLYTVTGLTAGAVTTSLTGLPTDFYMTYPLNGPPPSFLTTVGPACSTNGANNASCLAGDIINLHIGISNFYPWVQTVCGDVRMDNGVSSRIPQTALSPYFSTTSSTCNSPGIVITGDGTSSFGRGQASSTNWIVGGAVFPEEYTQRSTGSIITAYDKMLAKVQASNTTPTSLATVCNIANCTLPANLPAGVYTTTGNVVMQAFTAPANRDYIFVIGGTLTLNNTFLVPPGTGSTAIFSVRGNITVDETVGRAASSTQSSLDGIFSTDRTFIVSSTGDCTDLRLNIGGAVITNAGLGGGTLRNDRDLCSFDSQYPAVSISQRLDMILNAAPFISQRTTTAIEAAP